MIADVIHNAIAGVGFPLKDRFQKIHRLPKEQFIYDNRHPDLKEARSEKFVLVEIIISLGEALNSKKTY